MCTEPGWIPNPRFSKRSYLSAVVVTRHDSISLQIRRDTAEYLYVVLQSVDVGRDTDDVEKVLLETEWYAISFICFWGFESQFLVRSSNDLEVAKAASGRILTLFHGETN